MQHCAYLCTCRTSRYDRSRQSLKAVLDMQFVAAMGAPEGGRASIASRLQSRFNVVAFLEPPLPRVNRIYQTLVVHKLSDFKEVGISTPAECIVWMLAFGIQGDTPFALI